MPVVKATSKTSKSGYFFITGIRRNVFAHTRVALIKNAPRAPPSIPSRMNSKELIASVVGVFVGLLIANLIGLALTGFGPVGTGITILLNIVLGFLGLRVARRKKDEINVSKIGESLASHSNNEDKNVIWHKRLFEILYAVGNKAHFYTYLLRKLKLPEYI